MKTTTRLLATLLLIGFSGCTGFRHRALPAPEEAPVSVRSARVTPRGTGMMVVLRNVRITADSVIGWRAGYPDPSGLLRGPSQRVALHRGDVLVYEPAVPERLTVGRVVIGVVLAYAMVALYPLLNGDV